MKLTVFQADKGDCLLLESADEKRMLVDGGMASSFRAHVSNTLAELRQAGHSLDVVYVSHIDEDHIEGILALMDAELDWRVHEFHVGAGNTHQRRPKEPRPPAVRDIWHNGFSDLVDQNTGPITQLLAQTAALLEFGSDDDDRTHAARHRELGSSVTQGLTLSRRVGAEQLDIPLNHAFGGKLALAREDQQPIPLGSLTIIVIGPTEADLDALREEWNEWLGANEERLASLRARMRADIDRLGTGETERFRLATELQAAELGDRSKVTVPNLASLMLLVKEGDNSILLTGDGHETDILKGLTEAHCLDAQGRIHVDVLKVPHHGSEFNLSEKFAARVTADHYVFCANGAHHNPDLRVLDAIIEARFAIPAGRPFKLWFNSSPTTAPAGDRREYMAKVHAHIKSRAGEHPGAFTFEFLDDHLFELSV